MAKPALLDMSRWSPAAWAWGSFAALDVFVFLLWIGISLLLALLMGALAFGAVIWIYHGEMPRLPARGGSADAAPTAPAKASAPAPKVGPAAALKAEPVPAAPEPEPEPEVGPVVAEVTPAPAAVAPELPEVDMEAAQAAASARVRSAAQEAGELARLVAAPVEVTRPVGLDAPRAGAGMT